jgi:large subunit ribosomal protein L1
MRRAVLSAWSAKDAVSLPLTMRPLAAGMDMQVRTMAAAKKGGAKGGSKKKGFVIKRRTGPSFAPGEALRLVKAHATAKFDETVEIAIQLGVDPRKPNQNIRGVAQLPHGTGKQIDVAVFARGEKAEEAKAAGATIVGAEELVDAIAGGQLNFSKTIATPDVMPLIGKVARILGPRGLMPNPKLGTVTNDVGAAVKAALKGQVEFRCEKRGIVSAGIGKVSFDDDALKDNLRALMVALGDSKPEGLKGVYLRHATLASTMGRGIPVDIATLDPANGRFMRDPDSSPEV